MDHFAMNVAIAPRLAKKDLEKVLNRVARSAASKPSATASAASQTPGPVSQCKPSNGMRKSAQYSMSAWNISELLAARSTE